MNPRQRIAALILIMAATVLTVEALTIGILYRAAFTEEQARLEEAARSQARLIEAIARFDREYSTDYPTGPRQATIDQIRNAHASYRGFGATGEFTLATREGDRIVFILRHRHHDLDNPQPVPWDSPLAQPMRLALAGKSGTVVGFDYRGEKVLAAHEPVAELNLGIVAKIDLAEIRAPFLRTALVSGVFAIALIGLGVALFFRVTNPIVLNHYRNLEKLGTAVTELRISEKILNTAQKMAHIGSWHFDLEKNRLTWSNEVYRIFGLHPQEFVPTYESFLERVHQDDKALVDRTYKSSIANHHPYEIVHRIVRPNGEVRFVHEKSENIADESGKTIHSFGMVHDITETREHEQERERLIAELQQSLSEIRTLRGILPICASCKEIRDDQGYWHQIESYISDHSDAEFTHGICPKCARKLYPDLRKHNGQE